MTHKERYVRLFQGKAVDRAPFYLIMGPAMPTLDRWQREGLDCRLDPDNRASYFAAAEEIRKSMGFDTVRGLKLNVHSFVWPEYEEKIIEETATYNYKRTKWGSIKRGEKGVRKRMFLQDSAPVKDWNSWEAIKERLDPDTPGRLPDDWPLQCEAARKTDMPVYTGDLPEGFFGGPRELLGTECYSMLLYDDPELVCDILDTLCDLWIALYSRVYRDIPIDYFFIWEDMCYKNGPLISPELFRTYLLPRYKRLVGTLKELGVKLVMVDSDGDVRKLVPLWQEAGVDITFPWETQFGLDMIDVRRKFPELGIIGGINKSALAFGRDAIDRELEKVPFLLQSGRYIPALDHETPPEVSWDDFQYFCHRLRELIWKYPPEVRG